MEQKDQQIEVGSLKMAPEKDKQYKGIIYCHRLLETDECYVGETKDENARKQNWNSLKSSYGGSKIREARENYGIDDSIWSYGKLETVTADCEEELDAKLKERESHWIKTLDSVEHGFNANYGGRGMTGLALTEEHKKKIGKANSRKITVLFDDGSSKDFSSQKEAKKQLNMSESSISNYARNGERNERGGWRIVR